MELEEMGMNFTANIAFEDFWGDSENKKKLLMTYQEQLDRLVDYYAKKPNLFPVTPMLTAVPDYLGIPGYGKSIQEERDCTRYCGAGHEMVTVDVDGNIYPCHRFLPWVTGCPAPETPTNRQTVWEPEKCTECKIVDSCPTCAGFNWETHGNTGHRTTYHCEAYKLEVLASSMLEVKRLTRRFYELDNLDLEEKKQIKRRVEALWNLIEDGI
jgi:radical SAM protein with 4Fe4S-binding SPASM domain